jgi:hypothetical protein
MRTARLERTGLDDYPAARLTVSNLGMAKSKSRLFVINADSEKTQPSTLMRHQ